MQEWLKVLKLMTASENANINVQNTLIATAIPIIMCRNYVFYLRPALDMMPIFARNINLVDILISTLNTFPMRWEVVCQVF